MKAEELINKLFTDGDNLQTFTKTKLTGILNRHANQRVIEELERQSNKLGMFGLDKPSARYVLLKRIKELKQEI
jgi:hypothetical protein